MLPAPGDPRGLPGPGDFTGAALLAGEAVVAGGLGLIPEVRTHTSGSGDDLRDGAVAGLPAAGRRAGRPRSRLPGAAEAEAELAAALAETTAALTRLDVAQWRPELAGALAALRRPDGATDLPPGFDPRARRLFARAARARPGARAGRARRAGRRDQQLRGPAARRRAAPADHRLPAGPGRRLQRPAA